MAASILRGSRADTIYSADSVEWCPVAGRRHVLAVGTYQVNKSESNTFSPSQRKGRIYLHFSRQNDGDGDGSDLLSHALEFPAVLDLKWSTGLVFPGGRPCLAAADARGRVALLSLSEEGGRLEEEVAEVVAEEEEALALSLDWSDRRREDGEQGVGTKKIVASDSSGCVSVVAVASGGRAMERVYRRKNHDFEAWTACFDAWDPNSVFSGGDDCRLTRCDLRADPAGPPAASSAGAHRAGVTCLLSSARREHVLFSGSYDERLLEWDPRALKAPVAEFAPGGGAWRIKENPNPGAPDLLALACTDAGFKVVRRHPGATGAGFETVAHNSDHASLAYGVDWRWDEEGENIGGGGGGCGLRLASCSFYDHLLTQWSLVTQ